MNRVRAVINNTKEMQSKGVEVSFYHIKSELNLADRISKPVDDAADFVHSSDWKNGLTFLSQPISEWPVDKTMRLEGELITEVPPGSSQSTPAWITTSASTNHIPERTMMTKTDENQDASGKGKADAGEGQGGLVGKEDDEICEYLIYLKLQKALRGQDFLKRFS